MSKKRKVTPADNPPDQEAQLNAERFAEDLGMRTGRPLGAATQPRRVVTYRPPACPSCRSARRAPFRDGPVMDSRVAVEIDGLLWNHEIWRDTHCLDCGQHYRVIEYRFEPDAACETVGDYCFSQDREDQAIADKTAADSAEEETAE